MLYLSHEEWTAPRSLHEFLDTNDPEILKYVQDYRLNLVCPCELKDEDILKYRTERRGIPPRNHFSPNK